TIVRTIQHYSAVLNWNYYPIDCDEEVVPLSHEAYPVYPDLRTFPTRRSSDLAPARAPPRRRRRRAGGAAPPPRPSACRRSCAPRSEEHTSELQSRENLVCRLLLEKKNEVESLSNE